VFHCAFSILV